MVDIRAGVNMIVGLLKNKLVRKLKIKKYLQK
jgi:hypothetical protein